MATDYDKSRARQLYTANIRLAQAFHPVLSQFEVILRNSIHTVLTAHFADPDWIIYQKTGFMKHHSLKNSHYYLKTCIERTEVNLIRKGITVTSGKIISDQTFGFWLAFFLSHHYSLIGGQSIHLFPHKPSKENRASILDKLHAIKNFRNRVNHCEPLCFAGRNIDCTYALNIRTKIYDLTGWINPELFPFFKGIDIIERKIEQIKTI